MTKILADTRPGNLLRRSLKVDKDHTFSLKIRDPNQGLLLARYLLTKFYARREKLSVDEEAVLYLLIGYFEALRNDEFFKNNLSQWLVVKLMLGLYVDRNCKEEPAYRKQVKLLIPQIAMSPRAFLGYQSTFVKGEFLRYQNRKLAKDPLPARYIGVGYRDKGAAKDLSEDASPSWQTVASKTQETHPRIPPRAIGTWINLVHRQFNRSVKF